MKLRGTEFGRAFCAAGARNFFGAEADAYWFHRVWVTRLLYSLLSFVLRRPWGLNYSGSTFVSKTTTTDARDGYMPLVPGTVQPRERFPRCIRASFWSGYGLNKVGLTGPGVEWLLAQGEWQKRREPFVISFMAVFMTPEGRLEELQRFVAALLVRKHEFKAPFAVEVNLSCPNTGIEAKILVEEASEMAKLLRALEVPFGFKLSVDVAPRAAAKIGLLGDFLTGTNTVPFGKLPDKINWKKLFGSETSPLAKVGPKNTGGGGLSGRPLLPLVCEWIQEVRKYNFTTPIIGGGGVLSPKDAERVLEAGANAVFIGCASMLRPWRVASIIRRVNKLAH